jgi:hypothetical protein
MVNFFNETFRISYCELDMHVGLLRINFGIILKNYIFIIVTPTSVTHITSSKNREHSLLNYTMNMVHRSIIRPAGGIKQNRHGRPTATPLSMSGYSGVIRFGQAREQRAAPLNGVHILGEIRPAGSLIPWPNRDGRT